MDATINKAESSVELITKDIGNFRMERSGSRVMVFHREEPVAIIDNYGVVYVFNDDLKAWRVAQ